MSRPEERSAALGKLMAAIRQQVDHGEIVPCLVEARSHLWISDEVEMQRAAAFGCASCPALESCRSYVLRWPEPAGVWAGRLGRRQVIR